MPVTMNEVLLRGTTIKNSGNVHGLVIYTGPESRIQMNAARPPKKTGVLRATLQGMHRTVSGRSRESDFLALLLLLIGDPHANHRRQSYAKSLAPLHTAFQCFSVQAARHLQKGGCLISLISSLAVQGHLTHS